MNRAITLHEEMEAIKPILAEIPTSAGLLFKRFQLRHRSTYTHSLRVAGLCRDLAQTFGLSKEERARLIVSAVLHEVGVMETASEYDIPHAGMRIIEQWGLERYVDRAAIEQQGENMDGTGYPQGLFWRNIAMGAKIVRVADSFDRMTVSPLGSPIMGASAALEELYRWGDVLYDGDVVEGMRRVLEGKSSGRVRTYFRH